ncbi:MAG: hypothetical protein ABFR31_10420 [Thermodesulfobacteriota bacterium]
MDKKKLAAAMSAVFAYIKTSEEAAAFNAAQALEPVNEVESQLHQIMQPNNIWGISGRQTQMQANTMMQLRMFK